MYSFQRADRHSPSIFGGPLCAKISSGASDSKRLHLIACLGGWHIPVLNRARLIELPLIYGMQYDACQMKYRVDYGHRIELLQLEPSAPSDDWPYANYPALLPYVPLRLDDTPRRVGYEEFASRFPNMPERQSADLVVAVPPPATVGVSLWGRGDGAGVTIVFECDLKERTVSVTNLTS